jgi:hypothetical protein
LPSKTEAHGFRYAHLITSSRYRTVTPNYRNVKFALGPAPGAGSPAGNIFAIHLLCLDHTRMVEAEVLVVMGDGPRLRATGAHP